jgi:DNA-binding transcriptional LysR family regulator
MKDAHERVPELTDLRTLLTVLQDGTLTRAAQRLGVTQSALSYQLDRMRRRLADPLFVRVGNRMAPTPFTQQVAEPAARALRIVETEIVGMASFDPASTEREFRIGINEIGAITLLPKLVRRLAAVAPHARLSPVHVGVATMTNALESGAMDIAAGHLPQSQGVLLQQLLYRRDYVCVARRDHPRIGSSMTLRELSRTPRIKTPASAMTHGWIESQLERHKLSVKAQMSTQHVAAIPFIVAASDHVALLPREFYELFAPIAAMKIVKLPIAIPAIDIHQYWHPRVANDPAVRFLRELIYAEANGSVRSHSASARSRAATQGS